MSSTSAFANYNSSYELRTPYLTAAEYSAAPTSVDVSNLVAGGSAQANVAALVETIGRASSWIDQFCCGFSGTLCATSEFEGARIWGSYRNTLLIHPLFFPILEVSAFAYSPMPGGLANGPNSASITPAGNITIYPQQFEVAMGGTTQFFNGVSGFGGFGTPGITFRTEYDTQFSYVAGWPNTTLAASVAAGATSIQPVSVTGMYPGTMLTLYDMPYDEAIQVSQSYVPGSAVVPFANPLQYNHGTSATVTNLPPAIKQAAILLTTAFIKQRGSGALVVQDMGAVTRQQSGFSQNSGSDWAEAEYILNTFKQQFCGY